MHAYPAEITVKLHRLGNRGISRSAGARHLEVRPQGTAQEAHTLQHHGLVIQHMHLAALRQSLQLRHHLRQAGAIKLMVARNINHRFGKAFGPCNGRLGAGHIASQHNDVRIRSHGLKGLHAQV